MSTTPRDFTHAPRDTARDTRSASTRRYMITADENGPVIRSVAPPRPVVTAPVRASHGAPTQRPAETAAGDRQTLLHMRRFFRTALDRSHR